MRLRTQVIGALNLFSSREGALGADDVHVAQAMADIATIGILRGAGSIRGYAGPLRASSEGRWSRGW